MIVPELKSKYLIKFYNSITGREVESLSEIPEQALCDLSCFDYLDLIKPFVRYDIVVLGTTRDGIVNKYHISPSQAMTLGRNLGLYEGNNKKRPTLSGQPLKRLQRSVNAVNQTP